MKKFALLVLMFVTAFSLVACNSNELKKPEYTIPELSGVYGQTLADIELPDGFSWQDDSSTSIGNVGSNKFKITYTPSDTDSYEVVKDIEVVITVSKATPKYDIPSNIVANYGDTLADIELPNGFTFNDELTTSVGNVGNKTFVVTYTPEDTDNYNVVNNVQVNISVQKSGTYLSITNAQALSVTYGEVVPNIEYETSSNGVVSVDYKIKNEDDSTYTTEKPENAGTYIARVKIEATSSFKEISRTVEFTIKKAIPEYTYPEVEDVLVYGDTLESVHLPERFTFNDPLTTPVGNAGKNTFKITYTPEDTSNYQIVNNISLVLDVEKADPVIEISGNLSKTYDGEVVNMPTVTSSSDGEQALIWEIKYDNNYRSDYVNGIPYGKGEYRVKVSVAECQNYNAGESEYLNFTIEKADFPVDDLKILYRFSDEDAWQEITEDTTMRIGQTIRLSASIPGIEIWQFTKDFYYKESASAGFSTMANSEYEPYEPSADGVYFGVQIFVGDGGDYNTLTVQNNNFHVNVIKGIQQIRLTRDISIRYGEGTVALTRSDINYKGIVGASDVTFEYKLSTEDDGAYTTTVPTEVGSYAVRVSIQETESYNSGTAVFYFRITDVEISNKDSLSKTYDRNPITAPTITYYTTSGLMEDQVPYRTTYYLASDLTKPLEYVPVDTGDYLVVVSTEDGKIASAYFTISKMTPTYVVPEIFRIGNPPIMDYEQSLSTIMPNYTCSYEYYEDNTLIYSGKFAWMNPDDEPVYTDGWKTFYLKFVPDPEYINNYEVVEYIPVTIDIHKLRAVAPTNIEVEYGIPLNRQSGVLPSGWDWQNLSVSSTTFYNLGEAQVYLKFTADDPRFAPTSNVEATITVVKARRDIELVIDEVYYEDETDTYYLGYGFPVLAEVHQNGHNITNISIIEYKLKGAADSTYTTNIPSERGEYIVRVSAIEGEFYLYTTKEFSLVITSGITFDYYVDASEQKIYIFNTLTDNGSCICYVYSLEDDFNYTVAEIEELLLHGEIDGMYFWNYDEGKLYIQNIETGVYLKSLEYKNGVYEYIDYGTMLYVANAVYDEKNLTLSFNVKGDKYICIVYAGTFTADQLAGKTQNELAKQNIFINSVWEWDYYDEDIVYIKSPKMYFDVQDDGSLAKCIATIKYVAYNTYGPYTDSYVFVEYLGENRCYYVDFAVDPNAEFNPEIYYFYGEYWTYDGEQNTISITDEYDTYDYHILSIDGKIITIEEVDDGPK